MTSVMKNMLLVLAILMVVGSIGFFAYFIFSTDQQPDSPIVNSPDTGDQVIETEEQGDEIDDSVSRLKTSYYVADQNTILDFCISQDDPNNCIRLNENGQPELPESIDTIQDCLEQTNAGLDFCVARLALKQGGGIESCQVFSGTDTLEQCEQSYRESEEYIRQVENCTNTYSDPTERADCYQNL